MFITGIGTATPANSYTQEEVWGALASSADFHRLSPRAQNLLCKVLHADNGIQRRHLALDTLREAFDLTPDALHARFAKAAPELAARAALNALASARMGADQIDGLVVATCTGYLCPGLSAYISERLGLSPAAHALDLVGHGCAAAVPALRAGEGMLKSGAAQKVLVICVEICSAAFYLDNDPGVLISACLFADGAGAAILSLEPGALRQVEWIGSNGVISHKDREFLRFESRGGMLRNLLSRQVPELVSGHALGVLEEGERRFTFSREDVGQWIVHAGGRDILLGVQRAFSLSPEDLSLSADVLREFGNVSSGSVLFVLERALKARGSGGLWWLTTFGAGMACYGAALRVGEAPVYCGGGTTAAL